MEQTPVIFRKWHNGDIIALFPSIPGTNDPFTCSSYEHVGQHGAATPDTVIQVTTLAKPQEYAELLQELISIGYDNLAICKRLSYKWLAARRREFSLV